MNKIEPGELEALPVLDPQTLPSGTVSDLEAAFDRLCNESTQEMEESDARKEIEGILHRELHTGLEPGSHAKGL